MNDELIIGFDHTEIYDSGNLYASWPNGWPRDEKLFQQLIDDNFHFNRGFDILRNMGIVDYQSLNNNETLRHNLCRLPFAEHHHFNDGCIKRHAKIMNVNNIPETEKYIYPFIIAQSTFYSLKYFNENGLSISEKVRQDCINGKCKILINEVLEGHGYNNHDVRRFIETQSNILQIPQSAFIFADANYLTPKLQKEYGSKGFCLFWWESHLPELPRTDYIKRINELYNPIQKDYYFISLNRRVTYHRTRLVIEIFNRWKDKFLWSYDRPNINEKILSGNENADIIIFEDLLFKNGILSRQLYDSLPKFIDIPFSVNDTKPQIHLQNQAYIAVVTETHFIHDHICFFSEKIYKPIVCLQPFILLGSYKSLEVLREQGYKTFHPFINEDYDLIKDPEERLNAIFNEIERLSNLSHHEMIGLIKNCSEICIHNYHTWLASKKANLRNLKFMKEIKNWLDEN